MGKIDRSLLLWLSLLIMFWGAGVGLALQPLPQWDETGSGARVLAMAIVLTAITVLGYVPVLLFFSFVRTERERAQENTSLAILHHGWQEFEQEVNEWYSKVFDTERYPIPVTLALITFIVGWVYVFFHDGPVIIGDLATHWRLETLLQAVTGGQVVAFAFLGAYFFSAILLFKRYISGDLGPAVFMHVCMRVWTVVILALVADVVVPLPTVVLSAAAFLSGVTPAVLLDLITDFAKRGIINLRGRPDNETSLTVLQGMNAWKAARLTEEGIDNVQNLAMDDPSKLVVVTQESGMRILDWVDQALLYNYVYHGDHYRLLAQHGIRTSYDLYLLFRENDLITEEQAAGDRVMTYRVKPGDTLIPGSTIEPLALRNILLGILHHPNFEKIRQMREQAQKTAGGMFKSLIAPGLEGTDTGFPQETRVTSMIPRSQAVFRQPVAVYDSNGLFRANAILVEGNRVLTIVDVEDLPALRFYDPLTNSYQNPVAREPRSEAPNLRLAVYQLAEPSSQPVTVANKDPELGSNVYMYSHVSGISPGRVVGVDESTRLAVGAGEQVMITGVVFIDMPARGGDGGAPIYHQTGELAAALIGGNNQRSIAIPASRIRNFLATH